VRSSLQDRDLEPLNWFREAVRRPLLLIIVLLLVAPGAADAATRWTVRGAGFGHGVGMSQYGAYGFAQNGRTHAQILGHYYRGTTLGKARSRYVRVLLQASRHSIRFRGASRLAGVKALNPKKTYTVRRVRGRLGLYRGGRAVGFYSKLRVYKRGGTVRLLGRAINGESSGRYRGSLVMLRGAAGGVTAINRLKVDHYVRGVVAGEMPSSWHPEALKAQAVAARTYALATRKAGGVFDLYPDTRSQVYRGVAGEEPTTNAAVKATGGQVVTYEGEPIVTYYFSTSGGHTENVENSFLNSEPQPYLKGVEDPYDDISPRHRWRFSFSSGQLDSRLGAPGSFRNIRVLRRGVSPRIVRARVYGSAGTKDITGPKIRARLGLHDTWAYFTRVSSSQARAGTARARSRVLVGSIQPVPRGGRLVVERRVGKRWERVGSARIGRDGRYRAPVAASGMYRVRGGSASGPAVRVA
jgi:SpoIID/LytB domain protein